MKTYSYKAIGSRQEVLKNGYSRYLTEPNGWKTQHRAYRFVILDHVSPKIIITLEHYSDIIGHRKSVASLTGELLEKLANKTLSKEVLLAKVEQDSDLLPEILQGTSSSRASIRYGCGKVLMDLSEKRPEKLYPYMDHFVKLLDSKYRILTWNALITIANLATVDEDKKFDAIFGKYYGLLNDGYMVTAANLVGNSGKIALAKPYLIQEVTNQLLKVEGLSLTPHLTEECKRVIIEHAIKSFDVFFDKVEAKAEVFSFVKRQLGSSRESLSKRAREFLEKWE